MFIVHSVEMETVYIQLSVDSTHTVENFDDASQRQEQSESLLRFALRLCRKHGLVKDRVTLLSPSDCLQILQLCQSQIQQKTTKDIDLNCTTIFALARRVCKHKIKTAIWEADKLLKTTTHCSNDNDPENNLVIAGAIATAAKSANTFATPAKSANTFATPAKSANTFATPAKSADVIETPLKSGSCSLEDNEIENLAKEILPEYSQFLSNSNHVDAVDILRVFLLELLDSESELCAGLAAVKVELAGSPMDPLQAVIAEKLKDPKNSVTTDKCLQLTQKYVAADETQVPQLQAFNLPGGHQQKDGMEESLDQDLPNPMAANLTKEVLRELFVSYLSLLVNTRSELAFAHIFNTPDRGLTHQAFTHLKHQAQKKKMSLCQTATSVIMKLRIGARAYTPDPNDGLMEHVKGLGLLTDLMYKLQQLLEDTDSVRSSVVRVVSAIKRSLVGCQTQRFKQQAVEETAAHIQEQLQQVLSHLQQSKALVSPDKPACLGGSLSSRRPRRVLLHYLDRCAASAWGLSGSAHHTWLSDIPFGPHTPSRFPCVLSQYRSPAVMCPSSSGDTSQENRGEQNKRKLTVSTNLMLDDTEQPLLKRCAKRLSDTVIVLPSKTIMHPAESRISGQCGEPSAKENLMFVNSPSSKRSKKAVKKKPNTSAAPVPTDASTKSGDGRKFAMMSSHSSTSADPTLTEDSQPKASLSSRPNISQGSKPERKPGKKCRRRLLPPIQGQKSITSFFRV